MRKIQEDAVALNKAQVMAKPLRTRSLESNSMVTRDENAAYFSNGEFNTIGYEPQANQPKPMPHPKSHMMMQELVSD